MTVVNMQRPAADLAARGALPQRVAASPELKQRIHSSTTCHGCAGIQYRPNPPCFGYTLRSKENCRETLRKVSCRSTAFGIAFECSRAPSLFRQDAFN